MDKRQIKKIICEIISALSAFGLVGIIITLHDMIFIMNENQLLYLFSTMAQVIGGIFGFTLTAYIFFMDKFKDSTKKDETCYDATMSLLNRYFQRLIFIAIICGITISICITGIIALHNLERFYPFLINESVSFFLFGMLAILSFGIILLDPQKTDKEIKRLKKNAEEYFG